MNARWLALMCTLGIAACAAPPGSSAPPPAPLAGTRWVGVVPGADAQTLPRLEFSAGGRVAGFSGCNMMSGTWTEEGGGVRFGPIMATKRFCAGPGGEIEKRVMAALAPGGRGIREDGRLVLVGPDGSRLEFSPASAT